MTNHVWVLPEGHNYAVEFYADGRWIRREEYGPIAYMKELAKSLNQRAAVRVVKVSRYDPHPAHDVIYYREEEK